MLGQADALGLTGPEGSDLVLRSSDHTDHLLLRWRVENAIGARRAMDRSAAEMVADAVAQLFT